MAEKGTAQAYLNEVKKNIGMIGGQKIRDWYNKNVANIGGGLWFWCCAYIVYCAVKAGVPADIIKHTASSSAMLNFFKEQGRYKSRESGYKPKAGDIIFFDYLPNDGMPASHIGTVVKYADNTVYTIEGNSGNKSDGEVMEHKYPLIYVKIRGYGLPKYKAEVKTAKLTEKGAIYQYAYKDVIGNSSKVLITLKKGDTVTWLEDDGYGWSKVKYDGITGWIMNNHLDKKDLSKFKKYTLKSDITAQPIVDKKLGKAVKLKKGTKYTLICEIEKGMCKNCKYISVGENRYYI